MNKILQKYWLLDKKPLLIDFYTAINIICTLYNNIMNKLIECHPIKPIQSAQLSGALPQTQNEDIAQLKAQYDDKAREINDLKSQHDKAIDKLNGQIAELKDKHNDELEKIKSQHNNQIQELKDQHATQLTTQQEILTKSNTANQQTIDKLNGQIAELKDKHKDELERLKTENDKQIQELKEQHDKQLQDKHKDELAKLKAQLQQLKTTSISNPQTQSYRSPSNSAYTTPSGINLASHDNRDNIKQSLIKQPPADNTQETSLQKSSINDQNSLKKEQSGGAGDKLQPYIATLPISSKNSASVTPNGQGLFIFTIISIAVLICGFIGVGVTRFKKKKQTKDENQHNQHEQNEDDLIENQK